MRSAKRPLCVASRVRPRYQRVAGEIPWEHCLDPTAVAHRARCELGAWGGATSYMELLWHAIFNNGAGPKGLLEGQ